MAHLIEVAFRGNRKEFFQWTGDTAPPLKAGIIVEADRGEDFGRVHSTGELAEVRCKGCAHGCGTTPPPRAGLRLASPEEIARDRELDDENESARRKAMERVKANGLVMKLTDAEWQWDRRKLTFYFTAERRVDFRGLVRDLAAQFRTRIELKQIGVRDEAKRLSGIGRCGREYCSASWLPDLRPVNLGVAKDQKLSLNPQQISGACGRLMCCLRYEHEFYVQSRRRFPKEGKILQTKLGEEKVLACDIFNERVTLRTAEGDTRVVPLADLREEIGGFGEAIVAERFDVGTDNSDDVLPERTSEMPVARVLAVLRPEPDALLDVVETVGEPVVAAVSDDLAEGTAVSAGTVEAEGTETRRKRRRGRRGGRRLRAAEQRANGDAPNESANDSANDNDDDATDVDDANDTTGDGADDTPDSPDHR
ncbi:MAG: regulatory iron-sulfur-containing complex subunit RicT [Gemmatimonadota bacterium]